MMNLGLLEHKMPAERLAERAEIRSLLGDLDELATDVHNMSHQLHSSKLEHIGLTAALREVCRQLSGQHHVVINLTADQLTRPLPEKILVPGLTSQLRRTVWDSSQCKRDYE